MSLPAWKCHRPLPDLASNAMKLPSREAAKTNPLLNQLRQQVAQMGDAANSFGSALPGILYWALLPGRFDRLVAAFERNTAPHR